MANDRPTKKMSLKKEEETKGQRRTTCPGCAPGCRVAMTLQQPGGGGGGGELGSLSASCKEQRRMLVLAVGVVSNRAPTES